VLEEAPGFSTWVQRHASKRYTQRDFIRNNALGLAMTAASTWLVSRRPSRPLVFLYFAGVLTQQVPFNAAFHAGTTAAFRTYSPGLVTAVTQLPLWWYITRLARQEGLLTARGALGAAGIGGLIHTVAVAKQVFFVDFFEAAAEGARMARRARR
jgi:hypothetical protein